MSAKKVPISSMEIKKIQLDMLNEIDSFCRSNGIRYSLAFGTLLGAIRHKGYIPWDDDVDIIMPLPDMIRFKKEFHSEKLMYCDVDNTRGYEYHFSRICYLPTYAKHGLWNKTYGISIDLYPVVGMPGTEEGIQDFLDALSPLYSKWKVLLKWQRRLVSRVPFVSIPGFSSVTKKLRDIILFSFKYGESGFYLHAGSVRRVNIFDFDVFESLVDVDFEGLKLLGMKRYNDYLSQCYGDYMQLPPEDQRHPYHGGTYFYV